MRNKLIFESPEGSKTYQWNKHSVKNGRYYIFDRYTVVPANTYYWDRHELSKTQRTRYTWEKYTTKSTPAYHTWEKVPLTSEQKHKWFKFYALEGGAAGYTWKKSNPSYTYDIYSFTNYTGGEEGYKVNMDYGVEYSPEFVSYKYSDTPDADGFVHLEINNYDYDNEGKSFTGDKMLFTKNTVKIADYRINVDFYEDVTVTFEGEKIYSGQYAKTGVFVPRYYYNVNTDAMTVFSSSGKTYWNQLNDLDLIFFEADTSTQYWLQDNNLDISKYKYMEITIVPPASSGIDPSIHNTTVQKIVVESLNNPNMNTEYGWRGADAWMFALCKVTASNGLIYTANLYTNVKTYAIEPTETEETGGIGNYIETRTVDAPLYTSLGNPSSGVFTDTDGVEKYAVYVSTQAGEEIETVYSNDIEAYPNNDLQDGYYYSNRGSVSASEDSKLGYIGTVIGNEGEYPENGIQDGYWYEYAGTSNNLNMYKTAIAYDEYNGYSDNPCLNKPYYFSDEMPEMKSTEYGVYFSFNSKGTVNPTKFDTLYKNGYKYIADAENPSSYIELTENSKAYFRTYDAMMENVILYNINSFSGSVISYGNYLGLMGVADIYDNYIQQAASSVALSKGDILLNEVYAYYEQYPSSGALDGYWYELKGTETVYISTKGEKIGSATSSNINYYPMNGIQSNYWYVYNEEDSYKHTTKGVKVDTVYLPSHIGQTSAYNGYYYEFVDTDIGDYKGDFIETVSSNNPDAYPDGILDGYWYSPMGYTYSPTWQITDSELINSITYKHNINPDEDFTIGNASAASIEFVINDDLRDSSKYLGLTCLYYCMMGDETEWTLMGKFIVTDCQERTKLTTKLTAYDNISKFDCYVDEWIEAQTFPMTLKGMLNSLCDYCGVEASVSNFMNDNFMVQDNFTGTQITGRQVLQYIAQAAAANAVANPDGTIGLTHYLYKGSDLDETMYVKLTNSIYTIQPIDKVNIKMTEDDLGTTSGDGDNGYYIIDNPIFYTESSDYNQNACDGIYNILSTVSYTPAEITLLQDFGINCGDIITVDGLTVYVMNKQIKNTGVILSCVGNQTRATQGNSTNSEIVALRGKTNELERTLEKTQSTITDIAEGLQSQVTQTVNSISSTVTQHDAIITEIKQDLQGISLTYNSENGTASITIGDITVSNLVDDEYVNEVVAGTSIAGYVKFSDLSQSGSTVINGDNITTGSIDADRLNLTGAITWGDLTSSCRRKIENMVNSDYELPDYIHSTYIDDCEIYSPTIYGAKIYAGTRAEGYIKLTSTGMNFCSENGGALVGMGYYAGNYKYPYIIFGQGVDEYGTDRGMIKKFGNGIWIGDSDSMTSSTVGSGTGLFVDFNAGKIYKYINGTRTEL